MAQLLLLSAKLLPGLGANPPGRMPCGPRHWAYLSILCGAPTLQAGRPSTSQSSNDHHHSQGGHCVKLCAPVFTGTPKVSVILIPFHRQGNGNSEGTELRSAGLDANPGCPRSRPLDGSSPSWPVCSHRLDTLGRQHWAMGRGWTRWPCHQHAWVFPESLPCGTVLGFIHLLQSATRGCERHGGWNWRGSTWRMACTPSLCSQLEKQHCDRAPEP